MENDHRFPLSVLCVWQCPEASEEVTSVSWDQHIQSARSTRRRKEEKKKNTTQSPSSLSLSIGMDSSRPVLWLSGCRTNNIPLREPKSSPPGSSKPLRGLNGISTGRFKPGSSLSTFCILIICTFLVLLA